MKREERKREGNTAAKEVARVEGVVGEGICRGVRGGGIKRGRVANV